MNGTDKHFPAPPLPGAGTAPANAPRLPRSYVPRGALRAQLDRATQGAVTLVVAPAGAGKTIGVGGWLHHDTPPAASSEHPAPAEDVRRGARWITGDATWNAARLAGLLDQAAWLPQPPRLLVIDDAHQLPAAALSLLDERLNQRPESLRVVLLSRWDLPLTRLTPELLGHLTVLRGEVLRMTDEESAALVVAHTGADEPEVIETITTHAQGWCAAVVLMSRAVASAPDPAAAARRYAGAGARVADRVASEVFSALRSQERHLLLCTATQGEVAVSLARHLSHDPRAGEVLNDLETTGLLVTRVTAAPGRIPEVDDQDPVYRIHPLLAEVIRRRLVAGGVDVAQARSTVARAVRLDIELGETRDAFDRLLAVHEPGLAADALSADGIAMVMRGQGPAVAAFVRAHPETVAAHPGTWFPVAVERWLDNDIEAARHWMDRVLRSEASAGRVACIRLMRARLGLEPLDPAVAHAQRVVREAHRDGVDDDVVPLLLTELGSTQNWTGDLRRAQAHLATAIGLSRTRDLPALAAAATSHLALGEFMAGRERSAAQLAAETFTMPGGARPSRFELTRATLVRRLAGLLDLPWEQTVREPPPSRTPVHAADLCTRFWVRMRDARLALRAGSGTEAERILQAPLNLPTALERLPDHLYVAALLERALLASLSGDRMSLKAAGAELAEVGAPGEQALVEGLRADLDGDLRRAARLFSAAAGAPAYAQPASRELALVCAAQALDALGARDRARRQLREATTTTAVRRNAGPFLGWTRHGTPVATLLRQLSEQPASDWVHELADAASRRPDVTAVFAAATATPRERDSVAAGRAQPALSPREQDVLHELARGSTYADIAADLCVSENTVKTHVSSLYAKLAVNRRSEALAVARSMHLI